MALRQDIQVAWQIFRRDLGRLWHNPVTLLVVAGICFMPSVYAWTTIAANWDPYANTGNIKVAVANEDRGTEVAGLGAVDVGDELVAKLRANHQLGWEFTDRQSALEGVEAGSYYAAIVIPGDFSRDFASVLTGHFVRPQLDYYINEKISAVAPEMVDAGATTIETEVNETFVSTVAKTVIGLGQQAGSEVEAGAQTAQGSLTSGVREALAAAESVGRTLDDLEASFTTMGDGIAEGRESLQTLKDRVPGLEDELEDAQETLKGARQELGSGTAGAERSMMDASSALGRAAAAGSKALGAAQGALAQAEGETSAALSAAKRILAETQSIIEDIKPLVVDNPELSGPLARLKQEEQDLENTVSSLETLQGKIESAASSAEDGLRALDSAEETASQALSETAAQLSQSTVPALQSALDGAASALGTLRGAVSALTPAIDTALAALDGLEGALSETRDAVGQTDGLLQSVGEGLSSAASDLDALASSQSMAELRSYLGLDDAEVGSFLAEPVAIRTVVEYPVTNYGSGVAPFYTNLALWVSGFMLVAIFRMRVDPEGLPEVTVGAAFLGRWMLFMLLGLIQGAIVCVGDVVIGIQCESPLAFIAAGLLTSVVDVTIMFTLVFVMRHMGRAFGVVLLIVQIPGSSGEYPVEMLPDFFQVIHPWLPFTYSIDAMREAIGGFYDGAYAADVAALVPFAVIAFVLGLWLGHYAFNLNALFDEELSATALMVAEDPDQVRRRYPIRRMVETLLDTQRYREAIHARLARFERLYPWLTRLGLAAFAVVPVVTLVVALTARADPDIKVVLLTIMFWGLLSAALLLVVVEFVHRSLISQLEFSNLDASEMRERLEDRGLAEGEPAPKVTSPEDSPSQAPSPEDSPSQGPSPEDTAPLGERGGSRG